MQRYTVYFIRKLLYMFRVVPPPIIRSANNCIYSIWYLSHRYCCYLPLSWKSWNWFECAVGGVRHTCPKHSILCHLITLTSLCEKYDVFNSPTLFTHALPFIIWHTHSDVCLRRYMHNNRQKRVRTVGLCNESLQHSHKVCKVECSSTKFLNNRFFPIPP
jgi:hypothetical protein